MGIDIDKLLQPRVLADNPWQADWKGKIPENVKKWMEENPRPVKSKDDPRP